MLPPHGGVCTNLRVNPDLTLEELEIRKALVPGTPEYNAVRYAVTRTPSVQITVEHTSWTDENRFSQISQSDQFPNKRPEWLEERRYQIKQKQKIGTLGFSNKVTAGKAFSLGHLHFISDFKECVHKGISFKTKTFEYVAATGHLKVEGHYVGRFDVTTGNIVSWTLKYNSSNLALMRLRDFGVYLKREAGRIIWNIGVGKDVKALLAVKGQSVGDIIWKGVFKSCSLVEGERSLDILKLEVIPDLSYPIEIKDLPVFSGSSTQSLQFPSFLLEKNDFADIPVDWDTETTTYNNLGTELAEVFSVAWNSGIEHVKDLVRNIFVRASEDVLACSVLCVNRYLRHYEIKNKTGFTYTAQGRSLSFVEGKSEIGIFLFWHPQTEKLTLGLNSKDAEFPLTEFDFQELTGVTVVKKQAMGLVRFPSVIRSLKHPAGVKDMIQALVIEVPVEGSGEIDTGLHRMIGSRIVANVYSNARSSSTLIDNLPINIKIRI